MENLIFAATSDFGEPKKKVFVKVNFLKICDINTIKEEFVGDVFIQIRWREPSLDSGVDKGVDTSKYWNPRITVSNILSTTSAKSWTSVQMSKGKAFIVEKKRIKGTFAESLELHEYPFDIQDLSIVVSSELSDDVIEIIEDDEQISAVNVMCFVDETEWDVCDLVYCEQREFNREISESQFKNPALLVKCVAKRRAGFFLYNIILITIMITTLSLTTFSVDISLTQNRLQLSFIITLTGVTFKMVTNQMLPKIPYLTHLDRLILGSMIFNWLVCIWHAVISLFEHQSYQSEMDFWAFITFICLYSFFCIIICLVITIKETVVKSVTEHSHEKDYLAVQALSAKSDIMTSMKDSRGSTSQVIIDKLAKYPKERIIRGRECEEREKIYQEKATRIMGDTWRKDRTAKRSAWIRRNKIDAAGQFRMNE